MSVLLLPQEKSNQEIDLTFKLKTLQQSLEQEEAEHRATKAKLADDSKIYQSIEEAKSGALKGDHDGGGKRCKIKMNSIAQCNSNYQLLLSLQVEEPFAMKNGSSKNLIAI